jgi:phosphoribosylamine---glycine ligase
VRVLLVGSGGREHALAWALNRSPSLGELHAAPGNPGIADLGECHAVSATDFDGLVRLSRSLGADLVLVGPEAPLVDGLGDALRSKGIRVFGPTAAAARIEGSKAFAKDVMAAAGVPTAHVLDSPRPPCVVKYDGLAAGKGVFVCRTEDELGRGLAAARELGDAVIVEELLEGDELSVFAICDGKDVLPLAPARDFKRLEDGDRGPNTGGMGSYSPVPGFGPAAVDELVDTIHRPVLRKLHERGTPFTGLLYAGLMLTESGPRVLEFNCRFGDPETQSILPRLDGDLLAAMVAADRGELSGVELEAADVAAVTVVIAGADPLAGGDFGTPIAGVEDAESTGALVFHAGTATDGERLVTGGRRILNVTGVGADIADARAQAYDGADAIRFDGRRFRTDIAAGVEAVGIG